MNNKKIIKNLDHVHPLLADCVKRIESNVIEKHNIPMKLFETSRTQARHEMLLNKGKTSDVISLHLFNPDSDPPRYALAVDYVYYDNKWSWNLRDNTIRSWYVLFGNLVLDICPELMWSGMNRKSVNYNHFQLRDRVVVDNLNKYPCVIRNYN